MLTIALVLFVTAVVELKAAEISCEKVDGYDTFKQCCYLNGTAVIDAVNVTFAGPENSDVDAILFDENKKIEFLPVNVYRNFPNLENYLARNASVKKISALNFQRLTSLEYIDLEVNQIDFIPDNCFQGLTKLNVILLSK